MLDSRCERATVSRLHALRRVSLSTNAVVRSSSPPRDPSGPRPSGGSGDPHCAAKRIHGEGPRARAAHAPSGAIGGRLNAERPGLDGRIYITGVGSVSPLGVGSLAAREAYASGRRGIHRRAIGDTTFPVGALPEEAELELSRLTRENPSFAKLDRTTRLALLAAREARRQARFDERNEALGVILGSSRGATATLELR